MIVVKKGQVQPIDVGKLLKLAPMEGVTIQWLIHKGVGDERYGHRFAVRLYSIPPGKGFPTHFHKYVEAAYVLAGRAAFESESDDHEIVEHELGPGDILYTYPDEPHGGRVLGTEPLQILCCIDCVDEMTCDPEKQAQAVKT